MEVITMDSMVLTELYSRRMRPSVHLRTAILTRITPMTRLPPPRTTRSLRGLEMDLILRCGMASGLVRKDV